MPFAGRPCFGAHGVRNLFWQQQLQASGRPGWGGPQGYGTAGRFGSGEVACTGGGDGTESRLL